jgi:hypothetical protein
MIAIKVQYTVQPLFAETNAATFAKPWMPYRTIPSPVSPPKQEELNVVAASFA